MKVTIIHGQSHKGSTYHISKILADKIGGTERHGGNTRKWAARPQRDRTLLIQTW